MFSDDNLQHGCPWRGEATVAKGKWNQSGLFRTDHLATPPATLARFETTMATIITCRGTAPTNAHIGARAVLHAVTQLTPCTPYSPVKCPIAVYKNGGMDGTRTRDSFPTGKRIESQRGNTTENSCARPRTWPLRWPLPWLPYAKNPAHLSSSRASCCPMEPALTAAPSSANERPRLSWQCNGKRPGRSESRRRRRER